MIEVKNLSKYYQGRPAIKNISFTIKKGEVVGLLGLNGAGKSTILKILGCFLTPTSGKALVGGYSIETHSNQIRSILGYLPDVPPLYNEMTVVGFLRFVARLKNVPLNLIKSKIDKVLKIVQLEDVKNLRLFELSYGYKQRVSIAQAIVHEPQVLILDEPISGLDPVQIVEIRDLILSLKGSYTVLLSSHILSEVTKTCDRILILHNGDIVAEGREQDLYKKLFQSMIIRCELTHITDALINSLKIITGVEQIDVKPEQNILVIKTQQDCRIQISKTIIEHNIGLISLYREDNILEQLFIKFVKN